MRAIFASGKTMESAVQMEERQRYFKRQRRSSCLRGRFQLSPWTRRVLCKGRNPPGQLPTPAGDQLAGPVTDSCWRSTSCTRGSGAACTQRHSRQLGCLHTIHSLLDSQVPFCPSLFKLTCSFFGNRSHRFSAALTT